MSFVLNLIIILIILGVVILVHELGHLIACKLTKVYVEEFAIGLGPKIYSKKFGETLYTIRAFPIGGFNKIRGEDFDSEKVDKDPRSLVNQKPSVKLFIILSGVLMNLLLAVGIFYILLSTMSFQFGLGSDFDDFDPVVGQVNKEIIDEKVRYEGLIEGESAYLAGLPEKGYIEGINGNEILLSSDFVEIVKENAGDDVTIEVCDEIGCDEYVVSVSQEGRIGIMLFQNYYSYIQYTGWQKPLVGFAHVLNWGKIFGIAVGDLFSEASETGDYEQVAMSVAGPVGLYVVIDYLRELGWIPLVGIIADISLSIGIINLLPIPALDGGRALMILPEAIFRRPLNKKFEAWAIQISFVLLLLLMVAVLFKDVIYFERLRELFN